MARKPLAFVFGVILAMAVTILTITTLAAPPNPEDDFGCADPAEGNDLPASTLECILASASSPRLVCWPRFMRDLFHRGYQPRTWRARLQKQD
jgi:hypothetical protein